MLKLADLADRQFSSFQKSTKCVSGF